MITTCAKSECAAFILEKGYHIGVFKIISTKKYQFISMLFPTFFGGGKGGIWGQLRCGLAPLGRIAAGGGGTAKGNVWQPCLA